MFEPTSPDPTRTLAWRMLTLCRVGLGRSVGAIARAAGRRRAVLGALAARVVFWGALLLWCSATIALLGGGVIDIEATMTRFVLGAAACAVVTLSASAARLRWLTAAVGSLHGVAGVTLWLIA
jgi:hypothetical protein